MLNPYESTDARIENIIAETPFVKTFVLKLKERMNFSPGQFVLATAKGVGEAPFTISSSPYETSLLEVTIKNVGIVTNKIHQLKQSDFIGVRGPYGKGYPIDRFYGKEVVIVGGDTGIVSLRSLLLALLMQKERFKSLILYYSAKTPKEIIYKEAFKSWMHEEDFQVLRSVEAPDSSWAEYEGEASVLLDGLKADLNNSTIIISGPSRTMKLSVSKLIQSGCNPENIYLSVHRNMSCGLGKCGHCSLGKFYVCKDGPIFNYDQIKDVVDIWD
jgi:NAD(P)H-flavin reductase